MQTHAQGTETPLIYTSKGNVPIDSLKYEHEWIDNEKMTVLHERWFDESGELVKNNVHAMSKESLTFDGWQAKL